MINCQFRHQSQARYQKNWHNSLLMNLIKFLTVSKSSLKCSYSNSDLNHFLMNLTDQIIIRKSIQMIKIKLMMKSKKFWKSSRNKLKISWKNLLMILVVFIHLAILMNLIIDFTKNVLNVITAVMRWILILILILIFH